MSADIIPSAFIRDADFERVSEQFTAQLSAAETASNPNLVEHALKQLRNLFVLSIELRRIAVEQGIHTRILELLRQPSIAASAGARCEALLVLTCLYRSDLLTADNFPMSSPEFLSLIYFGVFRSENSSESFDFKSRLACLLALLHHSSVHPNFLLTECKPSKTWLAALVNLVTKSETEMEISAAIPSYNDHASVCLILQILSKGCHNPKIQEMLLGQYPQILTHAICCFLTSSSQAHNARLCAVDLLSSLCRKSAKSSREIISYKPFNICETLLQFTNRDHLLPLQIAAARCLVNICESLQLDPALCGPIQGRICENLVRLLRADRPIGVRIEAASILTDFVDSAISLQRIAGMCDGLIQLIAATLAPVKAHPIIASNGKEALDLEKQSMSPEDQVTDELTSPFLNLLASISANDEYLRRKVGDSSDLMSVFLASIRNFEHPNVQVAGLRCLLSLSRSAYQLRTTFSDHQTLIARDLMVILKAPNATVPVLSTCLAVLCNLLLSTANVKRAIVGVSPETTQDLLITVIAFTAHRDINVRTNAVWALMNLTYQGVPSLKHHFYSCLPRETLFTLLSDIETPQVVTCTLGLIRNLIDGTASEVDAGMTHYGDQVIQSAVWILEGNYPAEVKEQVLRIIANMASGERSRDSLLGNDDLLRKVMDYMLHVNINVQIAAVDALTNLTLDSDGGDYVGSLKRWQILETCGFIRVLNEMLTTTTEMSLFVKVKRLIELFSQHRFGICS